MKTYTAPTVTTRGSVVHNTLGNKIQAPQEQGTVRKPFGGLNLSFGL
jgi:hypothetical protein